MKRGLVLSGGGARGVCHLGVLKALDEFGITFDYLSGTSAGAIFGSLYSYGYKPDEILDFLMATRLYKSLRPAWKWTGLLSLDGLGDLLHKYLPENRFDALKIPLTVAATDIHKGKIDYFAEGELIPAILASCCVPAVFNPFPFNGGLYVDGGILDNLPVKAVADKCDFIVASHCNFITPEFDIKSIRSVIERSMLMAINGNTTISKTLCHVLIEPPEVGRYSGFDLGKAKEIFNIGYQYTRQHFKPEDFNV